MVAAAAVPRAEALKGHLAMLAFSALISGSFSLGGLVANRIDPAALNAVRFGIGAALMLGIGLALGSFRRADWRAPWRYVLCGGLFAFYLVMMFEGLKTSPPVSSAAVFTLTPAMSAVFGWGLMRQRTTGWTALALTVGAVGAIWVVFRADLGALLSFEVGRGEVIFFWGCIAHALYTPLARRLNRGESPVVFTFGILATGFVLLSLWGAPAIAATDWAALPAIVWVTILYTAILAGSMTTLLIQYGTLRLPSAKVMAYTYLTPSWVAIWETLLGHGAPRALVLAGVGLTAVALVMLLEAD